MYSGMNIYIREDNRDVAIDELGEAVRRALEEIGDNAEEYARAICPVDTGNLQGSITHNVEENRVEVGTDVTYGKYVELGTINMSAQPFLGPAIEEHMDEYARIIESELKRGG